MSEESKDRGQTGMSHKHAPRKLLPLTHFGPVVTYRRGAEDSVLHVASETCIGSLYQGYDDISNILDGESPNPRTFANIGRENERHLAPSTAERKMGSEPNVQSAIRTHHPKSKTQPGGEAAVRETIFRQRLECKIDAAGYSRTILVPPGRLLNGIGTWKLPVRFGEGGHPESLFFVLEPVVTELLCSPDRDDRSIIASSPLHSVGCERREPGQIVAAQPSSASPRLAKLRRNGCDSYNPRPKP
ncbi:hypothetical protein FA13DRAFT_1716436 [Coprinellus micaceus]|uniref:Uncharacterized protein n=1 Tax=Coprinellus micaceus TaxID=71717 RepID=A0A4Y7SL71_COPMI|nr:hypothetical protein FA13DRAFT_1716436 [Coprinellus micaceus]